jgi:hypothetical protein
MVRRRNESRRKRDLGELPLSGYSSRGARADPVQLVERSPMQYPSGCLTFANVQRGAWTCISSQQTTDGGDARRLDSATAPDFCGVFSNVLPRNPLPIVHVDTTQRKKGGWICEHDAMRTDDLHCGSCSASTQFSIHSLPPLWPKAPHGPNSQTT